MQAVFLHLFHLRDKVRVYRVPHADCVQFDWKEGVDENRTARVYELLSFLGFQKYFFSQ